MEQPAANFALPPELAEMRKLVTALPPNYRDRLLYLILRTESYIKMCDQVVKITQEKTDQIQLDVTYLVFDLEATRRERDELRGILEGLKRSEDEQWEGDS